MFDLHGGGNLTCTGLFGRTISCVHLDAGPDCKRPCWGRQRAQPASRVNGQRIASAARAPRRQPPRPCPAALPALPWSPCDLFTCYTFSFFLAAGGGGGNREKGGVEGGGGEVREQWQELFCTTTRKYIYIYRFPINQAHVPEESPKVVVKS